MLSSSHTPHLLYPFPNSTYLLMADPIADAAIGILSLLDQIRTASKNADGDFRKKSNLILIECTNIALSILKLPGVDPQFTADSNETLSKCRSTQQYVHSFHFLHISAYLTTWYQGACNKF